MDRMQQTQHCIGNPIAKTIDKTVNIYGWLGNVLLPQYEPASSGTKMKCSLHS